MICNSSNQALPKLSLGFLETTALETYIKTLDFGRLDCVYIETRFLPGDFGLGAF